MMVRLPVTLLMGVGGWRWAPEGWKKCNTHDTRTSISRKIIQLWKNKWKLMLIVIKWLQRITIVITIQPSSIPYWSRGGEGVEELFPLAPLGIDCMFIMFLTNNYLIHFKLRCALERKWGAGWRRVLWGWKSLDNCGENLQTTWYL